MFCEKCGEKLENDAKFCQNCGSFVSDSSPSIPGVETPEYYSENWRQRKMVASSLPYFDVMVHKGDLYLIQLGRYHGSTVGLILGLILFNILGAIIGYYIGNSSDTKKRQLDRSAWLNSEHKLISTTYTSHVFFKVPLRQWNDRVKLEKHKLIISTDGKPNIFTKNKVEVENLKIALSKYVL